MLNRSQLKTLEVEMLAFKKQSNSFIQQLAAINLELQKRNNGNQRSKSSSNNSINRNKGAEDNGGEMLPRSVRIGFPSFNEKDPLAWFYKANQLFKLYNTKPQQKLRLASFHMEWKAMIWYQDLKNSGIVVDWNSFVNALITRFGPSIDDDSMEILTRLRQISSVEDYKVGSENVSNRLK